MAHHVHRLLPTARPAACLASLILGSPVRGSEIDLSLLLCRIHVIILRGPEVGPRCLPQEISHCRAVTSGRCLNLPPLFTALPFGAAAAAATAAAAGDADAALSASGSFAFDDEAGCAGSISLGIRYRPRS